MNAKCFSKKLMVMVSGILVCAASYSADIAKVHPPCSLHEAFLADKIGKVHNSKEIDRIFRAVSQLEEWSPGPFETAGQFVKNYEGDGPHVTLGECFVLREHQPGNNKILHFQAIDCGVNDKWNRNVYVARQQCDNPRMYKIKNAMVDGHPHTVFLYVYEFDDNNLPGNFLYFFEAEEGDVTFEHPGHGKAN